MVDELKGIAKHSFLYGIGNWARPLIAFTMFGVYTYYLDLEDMGVYRLLVLSVEVIGLVFAGRIDAAVMRYFFERKEPVDRNRVVTTAFLLVLSIGAGLFFLGSFCSPALTALLFERRGATKFSSEEYVFFFRLAFLTLNLQLVAQVGAAYMKICKRSLLFSFTTIAGIFFGLACNIIFVVWLGMGLKGILYSSLLTNGFLMAVYTVFLLRSMKISFSSRDARDLFSYGLPLVPGSFAYFVITFGDNFVLNETRTREEVGLYTTAVKFGILVSSAATKPFIEFWRVRAYELYAKGRVRLKQRQATVYYTYFVIFVAMLISILIDEVIMVAEGSYREASKMVPLLALAYVFAGLRLVFELVLHMKKKTKICSVITMISMVINVVLNVTLIPPYGAMGAAVATLATFMAMAVLALWFSQRTFYIRYDLHRMALLIVTALSLYGVSRLVPFSSVFLAGAVKLMVGMAFPLVLWWIGFYRPREKRKIGEFWAAFRLRLQKSRSERSGVGSP